MATYSSTNVSTNAPQNSHGLSGNIKVAFAQVAVPSTFTTTDTASMFYLPPNSRVLYSMLKADDLDTGTTITLNVGDTGSATRYFSASTVAQAATSSAATAVGAIDYLNTAKTLVSIVPQAGPATTAGNIYLTMFYVVEGGAS